MEPLMNLSAANSTDLVLGGLNLELFNRVFVTLLISLIAFANVLMGCEIELKLVYSTLKQPTALLIGGFTQFFVMPILAYVISYIVLMSKGLHIFALGLFVTGCSPSGSASNFWTILLDGNANLSVTMTFFSMIGSLVTMPLWMNFLGYKFLRNAENTSSVHVPYIKIIFSLIGLVVPLLIGVLIANKRPILASKARMILRPFIVFVLVFVVVFGVLSNIFLFKMIIWPALIAGLLLPWCGFMFGCFMSILFRQDPKDVTAIAIETGVQNTGIAIMLLKLSFQNAGTDDPSMLIPIIVACFTPFPLLLGYGVHSVTKYIKKAKNKLESEKMERGEELVALNSSTPSLSCSHRHLAEQK